ncbi:MAG: hypothetical protein M3R70_07210 [Actinomycetota bacterium]|nr:hypothetical protein [Actinomycetota bacterium]
MLRLPTGGNSSGNPSMHREADVAVRAEDGLPRVETDPDADCAFFRPLFRGECALSRYRRRHCRSSALEDGEERIALSVDLLPPGRRERIAHQAVVGREHLPVALAPKGLQQPRRPLDVAEEEGDGAGRELRHRQR